MKYLFILLLGLGFSQTEWTTRVYEYQVDFQDDIEYSFTLSEITNGDLGNNQNASLNLVSAEDIFLGDYAQVYLRMIWDWDSRSWARFNSNGGYFGEMLYSTTYGPFTYVGGENHYFMSQGGDLSATLIISVTAEFPQEDTGYIEDGFEFCVSPGANLLSFPCDNPISVSASLPQGSENFITSIIGQGVATEYNSSLGWIGSLAEFTPGSGYWFKSNESLCFEYECVAN